MSSTCPIAAAVQAALQQPETLAALASALAPAVEARLTAARRIRLTQGAEAAARPSPSAQHADAAALEIASLREQVAALLATVRELTQQLARGHAPAQAQPPGHGATDGVQAAAHVAPGAQKKKPKQAKKTDAWVASQQQGEESWADRVRRLTALWPTPAAAGTARKEKKGAQTAAPSSAGKPANGGMVARPRALVARAPPAAPTAVPWQPSAAAFAGYFPDSVRPTILAPALLYPKEGRPLGLRQIDPKKKPEDWPAEALKEEAKSVLIVGAPVWQAHAAARDALHAHANIEEVLCIVWAPWGTTKVPLVADLLRGLHAQSPGELNVNHARLAIAASAKTIEWITTAPTTGEAGPTMRVPGYHLNLRWKRDPEWTREAPEQDPALTEVPALPGAQTVKVVCILDAARLLAGGKPADAPSTAAAWAKKVAWEALQKAQMQPPAYPALPPPMHIGQRGTRYEVTVPLLEAQARTVLPQSGRVDGVDFRPFADKDRPPPEILRATMLWLKLPETAEPGTSGHWKKLEMMMDVPFAGILQGDTPGRIGVRLWGPQPDQEMRDRVIRALGATEGAQKVRLRVWGYPPLFGHVGAQGYAAQQREVARATGRPADTVRVMDITHLKYSGINRPVFDVTVTGVDPQWAGATLPPEDARGPSLRWAVMTQRRAGQACKALGQRARLPAFAGPAALPAETDVVEDDMEGEEDAASASSDIL